MDSYFPSPASSYAAIEKTLELNLYLTPMYVFLHAVEGEEFKVAMLLTKKESSRY